MNTQIKDIRYFECDSADSTLYPKDFGAKIYSADFPHTRIGDQFNLKLREHDFHFPNFDHLYIDCIPTLPDGEMNISRSIDQYHPWYRFIEYGLNPETFNAYTTEEKTKKFIEITANCLKYFASSEQARKNIDSVAEMILLQGNELIMIYKHKIEKGVEVKMCVRLLNRGTQLSNREVDAFVEIIADGKVLRKELCVSDFDELWKISGTIIITKKYATIKPKQNRFAKELLPITFSYSDMIEFKPILE